MKCSLCVFLNHSATKKLLAKLASDERQNAQTIAFRWGVNPNAPFFGRPSDIRE